MLFRLGGRGRLGLALLVVTGSLMLAGPAFATVPCAGVQASINSSGNGSLIVLDANSVCTQANTGGGLPWVLPDHRITIDGNGAVVDGEGLRRLIVGNNIGQTTIRNFTFKNGSAASGGAVYLTGASVPTLTGNKFLANTATGNGGALYAQVTGKVTISSSSFGDASEANQNAATNGGGAYLDAPAVSVESTTFDRNSATAAGGAVSAVNTTGAGVTVGLTSNTFQHNVATTSGGAAWLEVTSGFGVVVDNTVRDNHIVPAASSKLARGAGFAMQGQSSVIQTVFMTNNRFDQNAVDNTGDPTEFSANGGGLWLSGLSASSTNDLFTNNDLPAPGTGGNDSARGGGIAFENCTDGASVQLEDDVIAGNSTPAGSEGAGVDADCSGGALTLNLLNTTIAGNSSGGGTAGIAGGADDSLTASNTVIALNTGGAFDWSWAGSASFAYSLVCDPAHPGDPVAGSGNICVTPLFLDPTGGDVRQLIGSPTIDAGDNSRVPFGLTTDFEGDKRIAATRSPTEVVDIGADERGPISCPFLQPDLNDAPTGSIITLRQGEVCIGNFALPSRRVTLNAVGTGATIDGDHTGPALAGSDVGATTLDNLTIRNGTNAGDGGGVAVTGESAPILTNLKLIGNSAAGAGGGVSVDGPTTGAITLENVTFGDGTAGNRNTAAQGGGLAISGGAGVTFSGVQFLGNQAQTRGGGASLDLSGSAGADISGSTFDGNSLAPGSASEAVGAGLALSGAGGTAANLTGNVFKGNAIGSSAGADFSPSGGGAWISRMGVTGNSDRFTGNSVPAPTGSAAAHGAGLALDCGASGESTVLQNEVVAGNSAQGVKGGGISFLCGGSGTLSLRSATVAGNSAASDTGGVWGSPSAGLLIVNSIVADNVGDQLTGFATRNVSFSDICNGGSAHAGTANLCAPPLLVNASAGDIHEPVAGPTVDKGSNAANIGLLADFEGDLRLTDGNKDGLAVIDMGADETPNNPKPFLTPEEEAAIAAQLAANNQVVLGARTPGKTPAKAAKVLRLVKVKQKKGVLSLYFKTTKAGTLEALTSFPKAKKKKRTSKAAKALKPAKGQQVYGRAKKKLKKKGSFVLKVKPAKKAKAALKTQQKSPKVKTVRLKVRIIGRLTPPKGQGKAVSVKKTYTIKIKKPRKKK